MNGPDPLFPLFLKLAGRRVVVIGGGNVAVAKVDALLRASALVTVVSPDIRPELVRPGVWLKRSAFRPSDLDGAWMVIAAAPPDINRQVSLAAEERHLFVNAVDDPAAASAYTGGVLRKGGATIAISTEGHAPALAGLLREAFESLIPQEIDTWLSEARSLRAQWKVDRVPLGKRRPILLAVLNRLYEGRS